MTVLGTFDPSKLDLSSAGPFTAFWSTSIGAFRLTGPTGQSLFVWYHEDGRVDMHAHALVYKGSGTLGAATYAAYAPTFSDEEDHAHELFLFLTEAQSPFEGHRAFYVSHGHLHLWATDVRCMSVHEVCGDN